MANARPPGGDRRPTKAEKKDEARRKREEIQRQMARRRKNRTIVIGFAIALAVAVVAFLVLGGGTGSHGNQPSGQSLLAQAASANKAASCSAVQTIQFYNGVSDTTSPDYVDQYHIGSGPKFPTPPPLSSYPSTPPASGPHTGIPPGPIPAGVYDSPPDIYRAIHNLEHGGAIVWYSPSAPSALVNKLKNFYGQSLSDANVDQDRMIVAPYSYPDQGRAGQLGPGVQMALVAWHHLETCGQVNLAAAFDFTARYSAPPFDGQRYLGQAPEAGVAF